LSNKKRGLEKERELKQIFAGKGYAVSRARGSFGYFDLMCMDQKEILLIQIKRVKGKYYSFKKEIEEIQNFKNHPPNTKKMIYIWLDRMEGRKAGWIKKKIK